MPPHGGARWRTLSRTPASCAGLAASIAARVGGVLRRSRPSCDRRHLAGPCRPLCCQGWRAPGGAPAPGSRWSRRLCWPCRQDGGAPGGGVLGPGSPVLRQPLAGLYAARMAALPVVLLVSGSRHLVAGPCRLGAARDGGAPGWCSRSSGSPVSGAPLPSPWRRQGWRRSRWRSRPQDVGILLPLPAPAARDGGAPGGVRHSYTLKTLLNFQLPADSTRPALTGFCSM